MAKAGDVAPTMGVPWNGISNERGCMHGTRTRHWMVALVLATAGIAIACTNQGEPGLSGPTGEETPTAGGDLGGGPQLSGPIGSILNNSPCFRSVPVHFTGDVNVGCVDVRGTSTSITSAPSNTGFQCEGVGKAKKPDAKYPNDYGPVVYPQQAGHSFNANVVDDPRNFADVVLDQANYGVTVVAKHPTTGWPAVRLWCVVDGVQNSVDLTIAGTVTLQSITAISGPTKVTPNHPVTLSVSAYTDNYNYTNAMNPAPTFAWSTLTPSTAQVDANTGVVTGVQSGPATIRATGPGNVIKDFNMTVVTCTAIALTPNSTQNLIYKGSSVTTVAGLTCPSGIVSAEEPVSWTSTPAGIVSLTPYGQYGHGVTIDPNLNGGTTVVKACTVYPAPTVNVCGQMTVNVARLKVTSYWDGQVYHAQPGEAGSMPFEVRNVGAGPFTFTVHCWPSQAMSCDPVYLQGGTLSTGGIASYNVPYHANANPMSGTIAFGAGGTQDTTSESIDTLQVQISNNTGQLLDASVGSVTEMQTGATCTWYATPWGGTTPYHYAWAVGGNAVGTDSPSLEYTFTRSATYTISVTVNDDTGANVTRSLDVNVSPSWPGCLQ